MVNLQVIESSTQKSMEFYTNTPVAAKNGGDSERVAYSKVAHGQIL